MTKIFTTKTCAYCSSVKKYLDMKGEVYEVIDLDDMPTELRQELYNKTGAMTVPITQIGEKYIIGPNYGQLAEALRGL